jgi:hypothetical protein
MPRIVEAVPAPAGFRLTPEERRAIEDRIEALIRVLDLADAPSEDLEPEEDASDWEDDGAWWMSASARMTET